MIFSRIFSEIEKAVPNWLFLYLIMPYWALHPKRRRVSIYCHQGSWYATINGREMRIPDPKYVYQLTAYQPYERYFRVGKNDVVLDVGASIGKETLRFAGETGMNGKVYAVEPNPSRLDCLRWNASGFRNVKIIPRAAWSRRCFLNLRGDNERFKVPADALDDMINVGELGGIFVKMDIEGAEIEALRGAEKVLESCDRIVLETHQYQGGMTTSKVGKVLKRGGFKTKVDSEFVYGWRDSLPPRFRC